jgi:hypothetical protein
MSRKLKKQTSSSQTNLTAAYLRRDGHESVLHSEPERYERDKVVGLIGPVHRQAENHSQKVHAEQDLREGDKIKIR